MSVSEHAFFAQLLGEPKISEFHIMVLIQEYITGFKISMKNSAVFASMASDESISSLLIGPLAFYFLNLSMTAALMTFPILSFRITNFCEFTN